MTHTNGIHNIDIKYLTGLIILLLNGNT